MNLNLKNVMSKASWPTGYQLPQFDIKAMHKQTEVAPVWLHMGAGNIFRIFVGSIQQDLLEKGLIDTGIIVWEGYDDEIICAAFTPYDNLTMGVTLNTDGSIGKRVIASMPIAFAGDPQRLHDIIAKPSMQLISFTITEKGYTVNDTTVCNSPESATTTLEQAAAGLYARFMAKSPPLALVAMDNFAENGTHLAKAIDIIAQKWHQDNHVSADFVDYARSQTYPWTMIDKITPRPSAIVAEMLATDGYADTAVTVTSKNTFVASFVNAEASQYLVLEDSFPNGRPPLEQAGVYMADRDTVRKVDQMKVCACLNPLHSVLAISGMLLNYPTIADCMEDARLVKLIRLTAKEALPMVEDPGILNPEVFLEEVLTQRFPNPFIPDTPARIASDTSQKIPVRFGENLKMRQAKRLSFDGLKATPLFIALWLRYHMGTDDKGQAMDLSPDPRCPETVTALNGLQFGQKIDLRAILSDTGLFGVDLYEVGLGRNVETIFEALSSRPNAVDAILTKYVS